MVNCMQGMCYAGVPDDTVNINSGMNVIGCLLSLIFRGWLRIAFAVAAAAVSAAVFKLIDSRRKKLFRILKEYV